MTIYFVMTIFIMLFGIIIKANSTIVRKRIFAIVVFGLLIIVTGLRASTVGNDLGAHYAKSFGIISSYRWSQLSSYASYIGYDIGYVYYCKCISLINNDIHFFIFVTSFATYFSIGFFIYKKSKDIILSSSLFVLSCTFYMYMTMLRQTLATSIILLAYAIIFTGEFKVKKQIIFAFFIVLASTFHSSAILCLIMVLFMNLKFTRKQFLIGVLITLIAYLLYDKIYQLASVVGSNYERYSVSITEGKGNVNLQTCLNLFLTAGGFLLGFYELIWKKRGLVTEEFNTNKARTETNFELFMAFFAMVCRLLIFRMNIINRFAYYFLPFIFLTYPKAITAIQMRNNRVITRRLIYGCYILYFIWMTINYAGIFYGVVPYSFFWN